MFMYSNQFLSTMAVSFLAGAFAGHIDSIIYDSCVVVLIAQAKLIWTNTFYPFLSAQLYTMVNQVYAYLSNWL